jgi:hypothetical protein
MGQGIIHEAGKTGSGSEVVPVVFSDMEFLGVFGPVGFNNLQGPVAGTIVSQDYDQVVIGLSDQGIELFRQVALPVKSRQKYGNSGLQGRNLSYNFGDSHQNLEIYHCAYMFQTIPDYDPNLSGGTDNYATIR